MSAVTAGDALLDALADRLAERVLAGVLPHLESQSAREALSIDGAAEALSLSPSTLKRLIAGGHIESKLVGQRRIVPLDEVRRFARDRASVEVDQ